MRCSQECTYCEFPIPSSEFLPIKILNSCLFIYNHINLIGWKVRNYSEFHIENLWKYEVSNSYVYKSKLYIFVWHLKFLVQYIILLLYKYLVKLVHNVSHMNIEFLLVFFYLGVGRNSELVGTMKNCKFSTLTFIFCGFEFISCLH